ncbi:transcription factor GTE10-like protein [Cinnamomum micranthum f. kanehirae]|uniref:Transcription factor GTE10-like protein n=1 Tax=Cinnamomum micranthum f. kanehirae TaxID=337451 RepID=A0A3S3QFM4_9MAGN|nr:transcription factor GTE10-like protein [Cinnamomum micranthum f. kanehirae]
MGKTERFSREGYATSFVQDYRHAVEIMGESEGFGSSGRVETEMTASEDSCAPKRKSISLNVDRCESFNVPLQVLSLSKMSKSQRKELELKLRSELDLVLSCQKKISARRTDEMTVSASSDILSCSVGRKRPRLPEVSHKQLKIPSGQGKKRAPGSRSGSNLKRDLSGRFESVTLTACSSSKDAMLMNQCEMLLKRLAAHKFGWVFKDPVDVVKLNIPDYLNVIKQPMDFGTIKSKMASGAYSSPLDFAADVRLTFSNAMTYNPPGNDVHFMADTLSKFFETRWKPIQKKISASDSPLGPAKSGLSREFGDVKPSSQSKKKKHPHMDHKANTERMKRTMTLEEKMNLSRDLELLEGDMLEQVVNLLREHNCGDTTSEAEVEVDIEALSDDTLFKLRKLVDDYMMDKRRTQAKGEACEIELLNESGLSNSSLQICKVNDPVDEDVDIGGNDPPVSSYPPVEIEKDAILRTSKCSSSSTSSSDSDSSSSDSDSGTSSGSESNGGKSPPSGKEAKVTVNPDAAFDQERSDVLDPHNGSRSRLNQTENSTQSKPVSTKADDHQEGGNAPSERHVSPQKLHRHALLKRRFADTILKAQEKKLDKVDKGDPEKLRKEREELERQQRAERARLHAEAKAAEDARRQAEAEAAAEAKRKREIEREAARLALQKMEKTVEINYNCEFLKDLEMLSSAPTEHVLSSVDEMSPDNSQDGLGSFKLRGSNPLEQLGLYMKVDYEEEEEGDADAKGPQLNDVEEGEID